MKEEMTFHLTADELRKRHKIRIDRVGDKFWESVRNLSKIEGNVTGQMAMKIKDYYGFRPEDVIFLCESHGKSVDLEEFSRLLKEDFEKSKRMVQC